MSNRSYILQHANGMVDDPIEHTDMVALVDETLKFYITALGCVESGGAENDIPYFMFATSRLAKHGKIPIFTGPFEPTIAKLSLVELHQLIESTRNVQAVVASKEDPDNVRFWYLGSNNHGGTSFMLHQCTIHWAITCDVCGVNVTTLTLDDHKLTVDCRNVKLESELADKGLCLIEDLADEIALSKTRNIPIEYHPSGFNMYVPGWVEGAISAYKKHNRGFAGMSLHEYLDKMAKSK